MYELTLAAETRGFWQLGFFFTLTVLAILLIGLRWALSARRRGWMGAFGLVAVLVCLVVVWLTFSPYTFVRQRIEPSIQAGEEVYRRYVEYNERHGRYPNSVEEVYFPELDQFHIIRGVREHSEECNSPGVICEALIISTTPLNVQVNVDLISCNITNLDRNWRCRDWF